MKVTKKNGKIKLTAQNQEDSDNLLIFMMRCAGHSQEEIDKTMKERLEYRNKKSTKN